MREEIVLFAEWYNEYRPHSAFMGKQNGCEAMGPRTPEEVYAHHDTLRAGKSPPKERERPHNRDLPPMRIDISYYHGRKHLPIIEIKQTAFEEAA